MTKEEQAKRLEELLRGAAKKAPRVSTKHMTPPPKRESQTPKFKTSAEVDVILNEIRVGGYPLTGPQKKGLKKLYGWMITAVERALDDPERPPVFRLFGLAGCGKTTMSVAIKMLGLNPLYISFTNRAVGILASKGCEPARTVHSVIYNVFGDMDDGSHDAAKQAYLDSVLAGVPVEERPPLPPSKEKLGFEVRSYEEIQEIVNGHTCIVVDEASMIGRTMGKDLQKIGLPIIGVGDPGQLPPVGDVPFFDPRGAEVLLSEVLRTDGDILEAAAWVRRGGQFGSLEDGTDYQIRRKAPEEWFRAADQVLCGIHDKRRELNKHIRKLNGYRGFLPNVGEKICAVSNNKQEQISNGSLWIVTGADQDGDYAVLDLVEYNPRKKKEELETRVGVEVHLTCFVQDIKSAQDISITVRSGSVLATWGYAITVHKAQGSEWPNVLLFDDSKQFRDHTREWAYTGATRAANRLMVVSRNGTRPDNTCA